MDASHGCGPGESKQALNPGSEVEARVGEGGGTEEEGRSTGPPGTGDEKERCEIRASGEKKVNDING